MSVTGCVIRSVPQSSLLTAAIFAMRKSVVYSARMRRVLLVPFCALALALYAAPRTEQIAYTISFPDPASKSFTVQVVVPTDGRPAVDLMMPVWSPGFYGLQNYAARVSAFTVRGADGTALEVTKPSDNRWTVATARNRTFTATYTVAAL